MTAAPAPREEFEARLAQVACREDAVSREALEREGWTVAGGDARYGSVWMVRPVDGERER